ncbi:MAG: SpoIIE family protein phosphatase [Alphaproteobacteria bacterium]
MLNLPRGTALGKTPHEMITALGTGARYLVFGDNIAYLHNHLPSHHDTTVLSLVAESWMLEDGPSIEAIANTIHHRAHLVPDQLPTLHLALAELITNAVEHGNLGLSSERDTLINADDWFTTYQARVRQALAGPEGRKPVSISAAMEHGRVRITVEDQGQGFNVAEQRAHTSSISAATGRGLPLLMAILDNALEYTHGGRRATFTLTVRPDQDTTLPTRSSIRETGRILFVTTRPAAFEPFATFLEQQGFQQVHMATNALTQMEAIEQFRPHLLIMDDALPDMAAPTLLHDLTHTRNPPSVVMMGDAPPLDDRVQAFHFGAVDYVGMDMAPEELALRCAHHLMNGRTMHQLSRVSRKLSDDLERARAYQLELLPDAATLTNLARRHGLDMAVHYQGCDSLAGDYWTVKHLDPKHIAICMVDFTGHGVIAALNTVQLHTLLHGENDLHHPEAVALLLNHHLNRLLSAGSFATYFYGVFNTTTGHLAYCAGGMPPAIVRHAGGTFTSLLTAGLPLAITPNLPVETRHVDLKDGDTLLLYSDALTDSLHKNGQRWDTSNLLNLIRKLPATTAPQTLLTHLLDSFYATVHLPVSDDLTLLALRRGVVCAV